MTVRTENYLVSALIDCTVARGWSEEAWGLAIRQARSANLLAWLAARCERECGENLPPMAASHFRAARNVAAQRSAAVLWECRQLCACLEPAQLTPVLLKGAAYVAADLPLARYRNFSDIDLMVQRHDLALAEKRFFIAGWMPTNEDPYDQRYYRRWMHEVPPLQHLRRGTTLDLHHAISPLTSRYQARTEMLFGAAIPAAQVAGALVLSPPDMILHAATHLFSEGEVDNGLRNLVDVAELLRHFRQQPGFDDVLAQRAFAIGLERPLYHAVRYLNQILRVESLAGLQRDLAPASPGTAVQALLDAIYLRVFRGSHRTQWSDLNAGAKGALYLRGHWLRMPMHLLVPHLCNKLFRAKTNASP